MTFSTRSHNANATATTMESKLNLLVRYLDHAVDDEQLRSFFIQFGDVTSSMVMRDILTGESRGFGFVRFACHVDAARALAESDGKKIGGKAVNVLWAKQQHDVTPAGQDRLKMNKLFLRNVPMEVTEQQLVELVAAYGTVTEVSLHNDKISAACHAPSRRIAFIVFSTDGAAETALHALHNTRPFRSCHDIPLMAKLSEDYKARPGNHHHHHNSTQSSQNTSMTTEPHHAPSSLRRLSSAVIAVPTILKFAEHSGCHVSTPNSTTARSPGISSLVPSLESTSLEVVSSGPAVRAMSVTELEASLHSSHITLRTPIVRRASAESRVYRHNPYCGTQMMPATITASTTAAYANSPMSRHLSTRV